MSTFMTFFPPHDKPTRRDKMFKLSANMGSGYCGIMAITHDTRILSLGLGCM